MFRDDEIVVRVFVDRKTNERTKRRFPVVGGRLRLAHETNDNLDLQTQLVQWDGLCAVFRCDATTKKGHFVGYGTANKNRDAKLSESLIEVAETRSIARALRFAGYGLEYTSFEEIDDESDLNLNEKPDDKSRKKYKDRAPLTVKEAVAKGGSLALSRGMSEDQKPAFMQLFLANWSQRAGLSEGQSYVNIVDIPPGDAEAILEYLKSKEFENELRQESLLGIKR